MALREIGAAFVRIFVKKDTLSSELRQAEQEVRQSAAKMEQASTGVFGKLKDVRGVLNNTLGVVLSLISRFTAVLAVVGLIAGAAKAVYEWTQKAAREADALGKSIEKTSKAYAELNDKPNRVSGLLESAAEEYRKAAQALSENTSGGRAQLKFKENFEAAEENLVNIRQLSNAINEANKRAGVELSRQDKERLDLAKKRHEEITDTDIANAERAAADAYEQYHGEAVKRVFDLYNKYRIEATKEWSAAIVQAHQDAFRQIESLASTQRNQSASGDVRTMVALLKQLVDK